jgi:hypothetical protein
MLLNKVIVIFLLSFANEVTSKKGGKSSKSGSDSTLEEGKAEIEAWSTWIQGSSMSVPTKSPVRKPVKPVKPRAPTAPPTPCIGTPEDLLKILSKVSDPTSLTTNGTPQNKAYNWLLKDKFYCYSDAGCKLIQRYIMALTYFSTDGDKWTNCGQKGGCNPAICRDGGNKPRLGINSWLSQGISECQWCGAACNTTNLCMTDIDLGTLFTSCLP